jgi:hypothetical protein
MTEFAKPIDVRTSPILQQIAKQVEESKQAIPLTRDDEVVAVVQPVSRRGSDGTDAIAKTDTVQSPDDFYAEAIARPDVAEILRRLAK